MIELWGLGCRVWGSGVLGLRIQGTGTRERVRVLGFGFRGSGCGFWVSGFGFGLSGFMVEGGGGGGRGGTVGALDKGEGEPPHYPLAEVAGLGFGVEG